MGAEGSSRLFLVPIPAKELSLLAPSTYGTKQEYVARQDPGGEIGIAGMSHAWTPGRFIGRKEQLPTGLPDRAILCSNGLRSPHQVYLPFKQSES